MHLKSIGINVTMLLSAQVITMEYYERIKSLRIDRDLTQQQIADYLGTRQEYYSKYELGKRQLPLHHLKALCEFYNVSADYILGLPKNLYWPR